MEIQGTLGAIRQLLVQGLARDFLGHRVRHFLLDRIGFTVAPPGKLATLGFRTLLDHFAHRVRKALVAQAIHDHIGHRLHVGGVLALGFPVNGPGQAGDRIVQRRGAGRVDGLDF
ncbi:hypothetical protein D3C75_994030 [compost metagenome]